MKMKKVVCKKVRYIFKIALVFCYCVTTLMPSGLKAQNIVGIPEIVNYSKQDYKAGNQNRDIAQDKNGVIYFANGDGLLVFDGVYWNLYPLPNKTSPRSIAIDENGKVFVGGQG